MFCVECGKEPEELYNGLCDECFLEEIDADIPDKLEVEICASCGSVKEGQRWIENPDLYSIMLERIDDSIKTDQKIDSYSFSTEFIEQDLNNIQADIDIELVTQGLKKTVNKSTVIRLKKGQCQTCSRIHGNYYEAIIQIRPTKDKMTEEQKEIVRKKVEKEVSVKRGDERNIFVTAHEERHGGLDFFMSDNGVSKKLSKNIAQRFGGHITISSKLAGRKDGRDIYKMTYSVRLPPYEKGDFVLFDDIIYQVKEIGTSSGNIVLIELRTGKKNVIDKRDSYSLEVIGGSELVKESVIVSETEKEIKILDPDDYQTKTLLKPEGYRSTGDNVLVLKYDDRILILPEKELD